MGQHNSWISEGNLKMATALQRDTASYRKALYGGTKTGMTRKLCRLST